MGRRIFFGSLLDFPTLRREGNRRRLFFNARRGTIPREKLSNSIVKHIVDDGNQPRSWVQQYGKNFPFLFMKIFLAFKRGVSASAALSRFLHTFACIIQSGTRNGRKNSPSRKQGNWVIAKRERLPPLPPKLPCLLPDQRTTLFRCQQLRFPKICAKEIPGCFFLLFFVSTHRLHPVRRLVGAVAVLAVGVVALDLEHNTRTDFAQ